MRGKWLPGSARSAHGDASLIQRTNVSSNSNTHRMLGAAVPPVNGQLSPLFTFIARPKDQALRRQKEKAGRGFDRCNHGGPVVFGIRQSTPHFLPAPSVEFNRRGPLPFQKPCRLPVPALALSPEQLIGSALQAGDKRASMRKDSRTRKRPMG